MATRWFAGLLKASNPNQNQNMKIEKTKKVFISEEGQEAKVISVSQDGMIEVEFPDGECGSYSPDEVEEM